MRAQRRPVFAGVLRDERPACVNGVFARYAYFQKFAGRFSYAKIPVISAARAAGGIGGNRDFSARRSGDNGCLPRNRRKRPQRANARRRETEMRKMRISFSCFVLYANGGGFFANPPPCIVFTDPLEFESDIAADMVVQLGYAYFGVVICPHRYGVGDVAVYAEPENRVVSFD